MEFKKFVDNYLNRVQLISNLFNRKELRISFDNLKIKKETNLEMLYFEEETKEFPGIFIFGFDFFLKELEEQEFKKILGNNTLNYKIYASYNKLEKKQKKVKITDILNDIVNSRKDSFDVHKILRRILTLAYYLNWELEKDKKDLEGDSFIKIPNNYLVKLKQRFNFDVLTSIYEDKNLFIFINSKGKMNAVFKQNNLFSKEDIVKKLFPVIKKVFKIKSIVVHE